MRGVVSFDATRTRATVRGGTRLVDLNARLARDGLALPIVGSIDAQSIAGLIATGTHGSSLVHGNLASLVERVRLIDGRGAAHDIARGDPRLSGARVHLGALGVITDVTLRVERAFRLAETVENVAIGEIPSALESIARSAEYVKVWWLPHTKLAQIFRYERTTEAATQRPSPETQRWLDEKVLHKALFPALLAVTKRNASWIPKLNPFVAKTYLDRPRRVGSSTIMLSTPMPFIHRETEAAMPIDRCGEALDRIVRRIDRDGLRVNFPIEVRFVRNDDAWMSPAEGTDTCQMGAYMSDAPDLERYFAAFWSEMRELGARPHWGKELDHGADEIAQLYPRMNEFIALRNALDPNRVFGSAFHTRALGA
jgi:L-gulonolactone oxidase